MKYLIITIAVLSSFAVLSAADFYVSPKGNNSAPGTEGQPFRTIQKAADIANAGDTCYIKTGRYRETLELKKSGSKDSPIRFLAVKGDWVVIDGSDPVRGKWERHKGNIWKTTLDRAQIEQLFVDDKMQHEARWPDMPFEKRWARKFWGAGGKRSEYGKLEAVGLGKTGVDWTGGIAMLNVGHQFFSWTRTITSHKAGSDFIHYDKDLPGLAFLDLKKGLLAQGKKSPWLAKQWQDDFFYLFGKLEAITIPTEWFHDPGKRLLYYMPQGNGPPGKVCFKSRDYGIKASDVEHIRFEGIRLMACAFQFKNCSRISLVDCHVRYPSFKRRVVASEQKQYKTPCPTALMSGKNNVIDHCSILYSGGTCLAIQGEDNLLNNSIIRDGCWSGTLHYSLVKVNGKNNRISHNTISYSGSPIMHHKGNNIIEFNHIYNGGLLSEDVAGIYTQGSPDGEGCRGAIVRYNWVHGIRTGHDRAMGIRGDDMTRGLIVHHNVVWDCSPMGIIVKGGSNQIFNNTIFDVSSGKSGGKFGGGGGLVIPTQPEPRKPWKSYHKLNIYLDVQNSNSFIANNLVDDIYWRRKKIKVKGIQANVEVKNKIRDYLVAPEEFDFRLKPSVIRKLPKPFSVTTEEGRKSGGKYIGAYEPGKPAWKAGANWSLK